MPEARGAGAPPPDADAPTCAACGYDLRGAWLTIHPGRGGPAGGEGGLTTCPECGATGIAVAFGRLVASRRSRREVIANLAGLCAGYVLAVVVAVWAGSHLGMPLGLLAFVGGWVLVNASWVMLVRIVGPRDPRDVILLHGFLSAAAAMLAAAVVLA